MTISLAGSRLDAVCLSLQPPARATDHLRGCCRPPNRRIDPRQLVVLDSMGCDPGFDLVETEPEMPADSEGRDRVRVPPAGAAVDEGLGHAHQLGDLLNR